VVKLQLQAIVCNSPVNNVKGNADVNYGGGGSGAARGRSFTDWDDEE